MSSLLRDRIVGAVGGSDDLLMNLDHPPAASEVRASALGVAAVEEARAALAEDLNLNPRLLLEHAFLALGRIAA
jgi:hypothetical protein